MRLISDDMLAIVTIWQEAEGEPYEGKVAVGEVIRARMRRRYASDGTVVDTCLRPAQFSGWNTGSPRRVVAMRLDDADPIVIDCRRAWLESETSNLTRGAVLYCNPNALAALPGWATVDRELAVVGRHHFYKD